MNILDMTVKNATPVIPNVKNINPKAGKPKTAMNGAAALESRFFNPLILLIGRITPKIKAKVKAI
ncbi:hypothetical protein UUU_45480 [Klebsiella pneumoniae subsp. pneumoniae DSM 30104 = JCM 1662 = NBRC 14940]|nr:hypothetical protein UUU_45480 [Klebsiella pneumoniae subsp. pneumoniae DSM 30104 = JCM 1662 = NBRC 14940]ELY2524025.1 hypothetical protein [Cronobacter sakazakii]MBE7285747.1 hypothetical protein [Salmonella enterica subsp. enterica]